MWPMFVLFGMFQVVMVGGGRIPGRGGVSERVVVWDVLDDIFFM